MANLSQDIGAQVASLERAIKTSLNADLKELCRSEGLLVSGVKATLQNRILDRLRGAAGSGDRQCFHELARKINEAHDRNVVLPPVAYEAPFPHHQQQSPYSITSMPNGLQRTVPHGYTVPHQNQNQNHLISRITFKDNCFYTIQQTISAVLQLPVAGSQRNTASMSFQISQSCVDSMRKDSNHKIMLYCAADIPHGPTHGPSYPLDITFPTQIEVKVNDESFHGNLRGIKKKPGTTRPADITDLTRRLPGYRNTLTITYAATDRRFSAVINMVYKHPVTKLVERIQQRGYTIPKQKVIDDMLASAKDSDIVTTSTVMSLKCPLSTMRMELPCRSNVCRHSQCFDATAFLQVQEQASQWSCPICSKMFSFSQLAIDKYVEDILQNTSQSTEQVTIEPDGTWKTEEFRKPSGTLHKKVPELEINDALDLDNHPHSSALKNPSAFATPTPSSREASRAPSKSTSSKRPADDVIDLTGSDDEKPVLKQPKRQSFGSPATFPARTSSSGASSTHRPPVLFGLPEPPSRATSRFLPEHVRQEYAPWR